MDQFAGEHVAALAAMAAVATLSVWAARGRPGDWIVAFARALAVLMVAAYVAEQIAIVARGTWSLERSLPLHLTDVVTIVAAVALWNPRPLVFELAYFWGLTASLQAVLTPDLDSAFPSLFFFTYFATHCGAVVHPHRGPARGRDVRFARSAVSPAAACAPDGMIGCRGRHRDSHTARPPFHR